MPYGRDIMDLKGKLLFGLPVFLATIGNASMPERMSSLLAAKGGLALGEVLPDGVPAGPGGGGEHHDPAGGRRAVPGRDLDVQGERAAVALLEGVIGVDRALEGLRGSGGPGGALRGGREGRLEAGRIERELLAAHRVAQAGEVGGEVALKGGAVEGGAILEPPDEGVREVGGGAGVEEGRGEADLFQAAIRELGGELERERDGLRPPAVGDRPGEAGVRAAGGGAGREREREGQEERRGAEHPVSPA